MPTTVSFFRHDSAARHDKRMVRICNKYGNEGYGIYFKILEIMSCEQFSIEDIDIYAIDIGTTVPMLKDFIEYATKIGLFTIVDGVVESRRMNEFKAMFEERSFNAAKAAEKRWKK